ncbi:MAG: hypothetical protein Q9M19_04555, partial [Mariprofundaceae bacterium]|nr:hypothetical protein [Mariprofundaceae bacterium]
RSVTSWATSNGSTVIEVTQTPYINGLVPSGTALASNSAIGSGGKGFRSDITSTTGTTFETTPILIYSGHDAYSNVRLDYASVTLDTNGVQMPVDLLPTKLVSAPMFDAYGGEVKYFADPTEQLFEMDAYRWAAEQFVCQTPDNPFVAPFYTDGANGNGAFCTKADALRRSLIGLGFPAYAPVTGRLSIAQFQWNVANGIPMFGLVRLMFPAVPDSGVAAQTCNGVTTQLHIIQSSGDNGSVDVYANGRGWDFNKLMAGGTYTGFMPVPDRAGYAFAPSADSVNPNAEPDDDGALGPNARIILYGSFLIDYFADYDIEGDGTAGFAGNSVFDAAGGERILGILESPDVYLAIEHNILLNPVMPRFSGDPYAFPTAAVTTLGNSVPAATPSRLGNNPALNVAADRGLATAGRINMVDVNDGTDAAFNKPVNLASPYDGYFPWSEGLVPVAGEGNVGTMRLMSRATTADNASNESLVKSMAAGSSPAIPTTGMTALLNLAKPTRAGSTSGKEADILNYYYRLMTKTASQYRDNDWPIAAWPGNNLAENFCIGKEDCGVNGTDNHNGDKTHLMFPSGYMHGWKVALAALDMSADEWNNMLTGIATPVGSIPAASLWEQIQNSCDGTMCRLGRPFSVSDIGLYKAVSLEQNQGKYFFVTEDATTGYGLLDGAWQDIPTQMYSGGLLDMHAHSNMNGIIYTPGPLEWEPGNSNYDTGVHMSYVTGSIITGYGSYTKNRSADDRYILVYDAHAVDNIATSSMVVVLRRYDWQLLQ